MFMRFRGGGVGHKVTREWDASLFRDTGRGAEDSEQDPTDGHGMPDSRRGRTKALEWMWTSMRAEMAVNTKRRKIWSPVDTLCEALVKPGAESESEVYEPDEEEDPDGVIADADEELDDDILLARDMERCRSKYECVKYFCKSLCFAFFGLVTS